MGGGEGFSLHQAGGGGQSPCSCETTEERQQGLVRPKHTPDDHAHQLPWPVHWLAAHLAGLVHWAWQQFVLGLCFSHA
jgi:hypothetical protein